MRRFPTTCSTRSREAALRLLVDTNVLLRAAVEPRRLPPSLRARLESPAHEVLFSAASIWEIAIKIQVGRLPGAADVISAAAVQMGFAELPITAAHAAAVRALPLHHRDPFDRLLVAQAMHEPATLVTTDRTLSRYSELVEVIE